jgi:hypothetical protein
VASIQIKLTAATQKQTFGLASGEGELTPEFDAFGQYGCPNASSFGNSAFDLEAGRWKRLKMWIIINGNTVCMHSR